jgi:hypothetical protein
MVEWLVHVEELVHYQVFGMFVLNNHFRVRCIHGLLFHHLSHQLGVQRIQLLHEILIQHQDSLDVFHARIALLHPVGLVVLVPLFDLEMQWRILIALV